ncbi:MAG: glycosyltransferase family 39 protein [Deltaproteobacteria bacterium]|nr:glycosyltransferase family 39 protein [Deltaproteobacteria bacterium]
MMLTLSVGVGIDTGSAVICAMGDGAKSEVPALGDTTSIAARREAPLDVDPGTRPQRTWMWLLVVAFAVRLAALLLTIDIPGDGPTHAMIAYNWSRSPHWASSGTWLPGFTYFAGAMTFVVNDPLVAPRLLNLILGSLTVPVFFALVQHIHGSEVALLSAAMLVTLPLHIGLSVSSLTEVSYVFEIMVAALCIVRASRTNSASSLYLGLFVVSLAMAEMTRYEAWVLAPLLLTYNAWQRRNVRLTVGMGVVVLAFPFLWSVGNYRDFGDAFYGFTAAAKPLEGAHPSDAGTAVTIIARQMAGHLGWILPIAALLGLGVTVLRLISRRAVAAEVCLLLLIGAAWVIVFRHAMDLGRGFWDRYSILAYVALLPFAALGYGRCFGLKRKRLVLGAVTLSGTMLAAYVSSNRAVFVTQKQPSEMIEIANWLRSGVHDRDAVLLTKMSWESSYLPLYLPQLSGRYLIVSPWASDDALRNFVRDQKPLLITRAADAEDRARIERVVGITISGASRVHTAGEAEVYSLAPLVANGR